MTSPPAKPMSEYAMMRFVDKWWGEILVPGKSYDEFVADTTQREAAIRADERERLLNTPELLDFTKAVIIEAQHQVERWGPDHDDGKEPQDWLWTLGYLGGKALRAHIDGDIDKARHHTITTAALCFNWHAAFARPREG